MELWTKCDAQMLIMVSTELQSRREDTHIIIMATAKGAWTEHKLVTLKHQCGNLTTVNFDVYKHIIINSFESYDIRLLLLNPYNNGPSQ